MGTVEALILDTEEELGQVLLVRVMEVEVLLLMGVGQALPVAVMGVGQALLAVVVLLMEVVQAHQVLVMVAQSPATGLQIQAMVLVPTTQTPTTAIQTPATAPALAMVPVRPPQIQLIALLQATPAMALVQLPQVLRITVAPVAMVLLQGTLLTTQLPTRLLEPLTRVMALDLATLIRVMEPPLTRVMELDLIRVMELTRVMELLVARIRVMELALVLLARVTELTLTEAMELAQAVLTRVMEGALAAPILCMERPRVPLNLRLAPVLALSIPTIRLLLLTQAPPHHLTVLTLPRLTEMLQATLLRMATPALHLLHLLVEAALVLHMKRCLVTLLQEMGVVLMDQV